MTELEYLAESRKLKGYVQVTCLEFGCVQLEGAAQTPNHMLRALQHVKMTGHTVRVREESAVELSPRPKGEGPADYAKRRKALRKAQGRP